MFYNLLHQHINLIHYITFRAAAAFFVAFILAIYLMPKLIAFQKEKAIGQPILKWLGTDHQAKQGKPTMGGIVIIISAVMSSLLFADLVNPYLWVLVMAMILFGGIGLADDVLKVYFKNSAGLNARLKLIFQLAVSLISYFWVRAYLDPLYSTSVSFPFVKDFLLDLGLLYLPFACFVMVGTSNAVNLTDGLDGLAAVPVAICIFCLGLIAYLVGSEHFASYLQLFYIKDSVEVAIFSAAVVGACLGFLWYNCSPAEIMMGDVGSLSLGGVIGLISIIIKQEVNLAIIGGLFVMETLSVIIQVYYFKFTKGKRIFKMAPLHHHFEKSGWSETKVVVRFWLIALMFAAIGLASLKVR